MDAAALFPTAIASQARDTYAASTQTRAAAALKGGDNLAGTREAAQQFEGMFVGQMLQQMWAGVEVDPEFGGGHGEDMWRSMLIDQYGKEIAKSGKLGIADSVMREMLKSQEQRDKATAKLAEMNAEDDSVPADSVSVGPAAAAAAYQLRR